MRSRICLVLLLAAALAGCADPVQPGPGPRHPTPTATPTAPGPNLAPMCRPPGVQIMVGPTDGAAGLRVVTAWLVNCGTRPYTVDGYPSLRILDRSGHLLPEITVFQGLGNVTLIPDYDGPTQRVTILPGHRVTALIAWRDLVTRSDVNATFGDVFELAARPGEPVHRLTNGGRIDVGNTGKVAVSPWLPLDQPYTPPVQEPPASTAPELPLPMRRPAGPALGFHSA
jgi:Protein of unknown function (DUF4232)